MRRRACQGESAHPLRVAPLALDRIMSVLILFRNRYWALKNSYSMDGLPALHAAQKARVQDKIEPMRKMVGPLAPARYHHEDGIRFGVQHLILAALVAAVLSALMTRYGFDTARAVAVRLPDHASRIIHAPMRTII